MQWQTEWKKLAALVISFIVCFYLPVELVHGWSNLGGPILEALYLVRWYAQEHILLCLVPAFFIAGAIGVFVSQASVMKYLGARSNKILAYGVASVSGTILAVCSCTVLPLFAGIYNMGAGLGPATAFLYSGPAINALAIILTANILGFELGVARAVGAIVFSVVIGLLMHLIFRKEELAKARSQANMGSQEIARPLWQNGIFFASMIGILIFANFSKPEDSAGIWHIIHSSKWVLTALMSFIFAATLILWIKVSWVKIAIVSLPIAILAFLFRNEPLIPFTVGVIGLSWATSTSKGEAQDWFSQSWGFTKQIMPLLLAGVLVAGFLLGRPGHEGIIPSEWIASAVGGNSFYSNFFAAVAGAFMYFATLTEVPILQGLIGAGMGKGPALALLLAGPALSLPNMIVIRSVMGTKKTVVFVTLVVFMATLSGYLFGNIF